jgi:hypothetical protein
VLALYIQAQELELLVRQLAQGPVQQQQELVQGPVLALQQRDDLLFGLFFLLCMDHHMYIHQVGHYIVVLYRKRLS